MNAFAKPNLAVDQIPSASAADKDKVLTIDENGVPVWAENQGGGSSGGGVLIVTDTHGTLDKTWQEIHDAPFAVVISGDSRMPVINALGFGSAYVIGCVGDPTGEDIKTVIYRASSSDEYPAIQS